MKLKDVLAVKNHKNALEYIVDLVEEEKEIDKKTLLHLHELLFQDIDDSAGRFRTTTVVIGEAWFMPPPAHEIQDKILELLKWLRDTLNKLEPIELATIFHYKFVYIHPFKEGNGRVARLLMNYILMRHGYPFIAIVEESERHKYLEALHIADIGNLKEFINFIAKTVEKAINVLLIVIEKSEILSLAEASKLSPYSQEYLSLLSRKGVIGSFKQGRNWYITKDDLYRYVNSIEVKRQRAKLRKKQKVT